ncbi:hypothetical protein MA5S0422_4892 [Mycobacteroides abscessus 5S-0422]|uniref:DUF385 domain-containing protein n=1 Tax=Mycobacteroides abscessus subsp. bolletii 1513 TaxID=1299321 RepID=X8DIV4_9MYCO|nr:nitroreductase/quinone reductase family protein [Mycobacteroides abscessus]EUA67390.1 hypothetical protein I540_5060 [Mycobacteroides abscessus subsp. bolletii 1513]EIU05021.1 hypothetical protein MA5S0422_4892 [Mycobacteroides abscessus 5S-0422]EIU05575.1 hypothetical protein MA5S0421_3973 [Mycobacteroides abscessus 5S-0421]EIU09447.1 hypothetical protein MA5S0304_3719 [Mycobacteroides abscessus 5S-0304]EIU20394.1 hypothetical protein MA5S0708_3645 [Mycobacteroides abscessus 5S-0708]
MNSLFRRFVDAVNTVPVMALNVPGLRSLAGRYFTVVTYTGRRSGQIFSTPVNYWRSGDDIVIWVGIPESKTWWRNFLGEGRPLQFRLNGVDVPGYGIARKDDNGRVTVTVRLGESV